MSRDAAETDRTAEEPEGAAPLVVVHPSRARLSGGVAARLLVALLDAQAERGWADVALTGGSMGSAVVAAVAESPLSELVDWERVGIWWGDERYLPAGAEERNDRQNDDAGLRRLGIPAEHVHRVQGPDESASAEESAAAYEQALRGHGRGTFDVVMLGVGPDGHIASLFPGHPSQLADETIAVAVHDSPKPPPDRVSLTLGCLARSREVWFVVAGEDKAEAVVKGTSGAPPQESTAALLRGQERTLWLVDAAAAGAQLSG